MTIDPTQVSFSQAQGYEPLPQPLQLGELSQKARIRFWDAFYTQLVRADEFIRLFLSLHTEFLERSIDEFPYSRLPDSALNFDYDDFRLGFKKDFLERPFNEIFDLLTFIMRHKECPNEFIQEVGKVFLNCHLAYVLDEHNPPTIYPIATPEEGKAVVAAVNELATYGLDGARQHLMQSAAFIHQGEWARSVHESISAVESVARQIAPGTNSLGAALNQLRRDGLLEHRALEQGLGNLYGYTSDEQGVRHSLLDQGQSNVGQDEAVFMLGACASFASYLWRKHLASGSTS